MRKVLIAGALVLLVVLAVPFYFRIGWDRMTGECGFGSSPLEDRRIDAHVPWNGETGETSSRSVSYSWHIQGGFTCTYSNGYQRSSSWF